MRDKVVIILDGQMWPGAVDCVLLLRYHSKAMGGTFVTLIQQATRRTTSRQSIKGTALQ